jgi:hypothetical protein
MFLDTSEIGAIGRMIINQGTLGYSIVRHTNLVDCAGFILFNIQLEYTMDGLPHRWFNQIA